MVEKHSVNIIILSLNLNFLNFFSDCEKLASFKYWLVGANHKLFMNINNVILLSKNLAK